jgi:hypothetical protein
MSTALMGFMAAPALSGDIVAPPDDSLLFSALFGISAGIQDATRGDDDVDLDEGTDLTIAGYGMVSIPLGEAFSAQLDGQGELYDRASQNEDDPQGAYMLGGHLSLRDPGMGLIGIFVGAGMGQNDDAEDDGDGIGYIAGVEGQLYLDQFTFYAQGGWGDIIVDDNPEEGFNSGWFVRGVARYFFTDDFLLQAEVSYGEVGQYIDGDDDGEFWNWGAQAKMRLSESMPIYGTLEYRGGNYWTADQDGDEAEEHVGLIGLSFAFGVDNLFENDRRGATLDTPMLPARAAAWTETLD